MIAEVAAVIASINGVREIASRLKESAEKSKLLAAIQQTQGQLIDLQSVIMNTKQELATTQDRARAAEQKCVDLEKWGVEAEQYELNEVAPGVFAYTSKPSMEGSDPPHHLCANCFIDHRKSILQLESSRMYIPALVCPRCQFRIRLPQGMRPPKRS